MLSLTLWAIALLTLAVSYSKDKERTGKALRIGLRSFSALFPSMVGMVGLVGLALALLPPDLLSNLFKHNGAIGFILIATVGSIVSMPAPVAFPLAGSLLKLGVSLSSLAAFITTLTMVGVLTAPMEMAVFGTRFTLVRQGLSFLLAIAVGLLMGVVL